MVARLGSQPKSWFPASLPRQSSTGSPTEGGQCWFNFSRNR